MYTYLLYNVHYEMVLYVIIFTELLIIKGIVSPYIWRPINWFSIDIAKDPTVYSRGSRFISELHWLRSGQVALEILCLIHFILFDIFSHFLERKFLKKVQYNTILWSENKKTEHEFRNFMLILRVSLVNFILI